MHAGEKIADPPPPLPPPLRRPGKWLRKCAARNPETVCYFIYCHFLEREWARNVFRKDIAKNGKRGSIASEEKKEIVLRNVIRINRALTADVMLRLNGDSPETERKDVG